MPTNITVMVRLQITKHTYKQTEEKIYMICVKQHFTFHPTHRLQLSPP